MTFKKLKKIIHEAKKIDMKQRDITELAYCFDLFSDNNNKEGMLLKIAEAFVYIIKFEDYKFQDKKMYKDAVRHYNSLEKGLLDNNDGRKFIFQNALRENDLSELLALVDLLGYKEDFYNLIAKYISDLQMFNGIKKE